MTEVCGGSWGSAVAVSEAPRVKDEGELAFAFLRG